VRAAAEIGAADVTGADLHSQTLTFAPRATAHGSYTFAVGSAGSATLVLQTVLPALLHASGPTTLTLEGGTHNPMAPPFDFLARAFAPLAARVGARIAVSLDRHGFYPAGGGVMRAEVSPKEAAAPLALLDRGELVAHRARALVANVPGSVAAREIATLCAELGWDPACGRPEMVKSPGPGNALVVEIEHANVTEVFIGFGERGVSAESVARGVAREVKRYLAAGVPVGEHLADQLLLPMALGPGGAFRTVAPSMHLRTQMDVLRMFLGIDVTATEEASDVWRIDVPVAANAA
jgi:RNA 3'-terminal phosphate cyclase (ATP)